MQPNKNEILDNENVCLGNDEQIRVIFWVSLLFLIFIFLGLLFDWLRTDFNGWPFFKLEILFILIIPYSLQIIDFDECFIFVFLIFVFLVDESLYSDNYNHKFFMAWNIKNRLSLFIFEVLDSIN